MAELQKERGTAKLPKRERMTIRKLFAAEQQLNFLASYAELPLEERGVIVPPAAGTDATNRPGGNNRSWIKDTLKKWIFE